MTGTLTIFGVVLIARPEFIFGAKESTIDHEYRLEGTLLAVTAALSAAYSMINIRKLKTTPPSVVVMWFGTTVLCSSLIILAIINQYSWPQGWYNWGMLVVAGSCGIGDQYFLCLALKYESAGPVSVTRTLNIVLSFLWGVFLLGEDSELTSLIGALLITLCVLILALVKWRAENPSSFYSFSNKLFCCCKTGNLKNSSINRGKSVSNQPSIRGSTSSLDSDVVQSTVHSSAVLVKKYGINGMNK